MSPNTMSDALPLAQARIKVPQHVVFRAFPSETVVLNLQTGKYHGLNATAGRMLEALEKAPSVRDAAVAVAAGYEGRQDVALVERDMCELCRLLLDRGLIEIDGVPAG